MDGELRNHQALLELPRHYTPEKFRAAVEANLTELDAAGREKALIVTDTKLIKMLDTPLQVFADSNWRDAETGLQIHFAVVYNVGKGALELWSVNEDKSGLALMPEDKWSKVTWDIITDRRFLG